MAMTQGFLHVGEAISGTESTHRLQNAITPPALATVSLGLGFLMIAGIAYGFSSLGLGMTFTNLALALVSTWTGTKFAPKADSIFYAKMVYGSLVRRSADYAKANDHIRSGASKDLYERISERYHDALEKHTLISARF